MTNTNPIETLRRQGAEQAASDSETYWTLASKVAAGRNVKPSDIEAALRATENDLDTFERHVALMRSVQEAQAHADSFDFNALAEREAKAEKALKEMLTEHERLMREMPKREAKAREQVNVAYAQTKRAQRARRDLEDALREVRIARGIEKPQSERTEAPQRVEVTRTRLPGADNPKDPSRFDLIQTREGKLVYREKATGRTIPAS